MHNTRKNIGVLPVPAPEPEFLNLDPRNRFQGNSSASLCSLAVRYDNPIPTRFLALIDCLKIPALLFHCSTLIGEGGGQCDGQSS
jgi:hypothetical protein